MIEIKIDKLYRYDRKSEPCFIGFPLPKGKLSDENTVRLFDGSTSLPVQSKVTGRYADGSIRFLFLRFLADLPANKGKVLECVFEESELKAHESAQSYDYSPVVAEDNDGGYHVQTTDEKSGKVFSFNIKNNADFVFEDITANGRTWNAEQIAGPLLKDGQGENYGIKLGDWQAVENGPICAIYKNYGKHIKANGADGPEFEIKLTAYAGKSWIEFSYRLINTTDEAFEVKRLELDLWRDTALKDTVKSCAYIPKNLDSTGCGDAAKGTDNEMVCHAPSTDAAEKIVQSLSAEEVRTIAATSNYKTDYLIGKNGAGVGRLIDAEWLLKEANEHFAEVFYGTFFADCTDAKGGVAATIFQAHQNYPKAVLAGEGGIRVMLVPEDVEKIVLQSGMSREQKCLLHFHDAEMTVSEINDRSIIYQMPDRPYVSPAVHAASGVWPDIFPKKTDVRVEQNLVCRGDAHGRAYGMLHFGDSYDSNYTAQGRGGGRLVWCNNEYDYPHSCALMFARTGIRRFLDYNIASCSHWMDVDVCHYHKDPIYRGGQWEHTAGHCENGVMVCSHEWVEGLLDYYHLTGDERGLETAIGIGENVNRLLELPMYAKAGEANARETGWALRTLTALYVETGDDKWLEKCGRIVNDFRVWEEQYGHWLAPYTDNTLVRVGFMISIAVGSLMRYYRVFPDPELKAMILRAVDDLVENCYVEEWGVFYYKELPSLNRVGNNTLLLEALAAAYDLSGNRRYLDYGIETFRNAISDKQPLAGGAKRREENAVLLGSMSSKTFAQSMIPLTTYYRALSACGESI